MSVHFHVGQSVVCVDDAFTDREKHWTPNRPVKGQTYVLREIGDYHRGIGVTLVEVVNKPIPVVRTADRSIFYMEPVFSVRRFRPVVERKTSIEIFTAMLTPSKVRA